ncbi:MAG: gliding motility-associated C-terminal domain-containing protein [Flavobacterium sp.]|nr:gliding motility-associated C-terminal domain-containing protein [Flavobacterium sp.]
MKKIYLLVVLFLSLFSLNSYAKSTIVYGKIVIPKIDSDFLTNSKSNLILAAPTSSPRASSTSLCEGESLTLTANPSGGIAPYTFSWTGPNGYVSTDENPVITTIGLSGSGIYSLVVTDALNATSTIQSTEAITINAKIDPEFDATLPAICKDGIAPLLSPTSTNGISGTWSPSVVNNTATANYLFTPDSGQCANTFSFIVFVVKNVTPVFTLPTSICFGATPPVLNNISNNGIVGTWNPATVSNAASGTYTFTPAQNIGQCALPKTVQIIVNPTIAVFSPPILPICAGAFLAPLPTTSTNGITGSWTPSLDNTKTTLYTFTPTGGQCATATTEITIIVNPNITPTFSFVTSICENDAAPLLPQISDNGITGTWNPTTVSNTATGTYTFTSAAGQCANPAPPITVTVKPFLTPIFSFVTSICENDTAPLLPTISDNGITGTWNPTTVSNTATGTYTFTSFIGQCSNPTPPITVTVKPFLTPTFSFVTSICKNDTAPLLPTISNNGIIGTWNPTTVSNTATGTYTFTSAGGQCTNPAQPITVTVKPFLTPTFSFVTSICENDAAPLLPTISDNGITGTWNTPAVSNTATGTYTFTPAGGQCTNPAPPITVTVKPFLTPTFSFVMSICENDAAPLLPTISDNGIAGTWNPTTVSNTTTGTYTFTSAGAQCANPAPPITLTVKPFLTPTFSFVTSICENDTAPLLPSISDNGITGTWNPTTVSNTATVTYTFTSAVGQCANPSPPITVTVKPFLTPTFSFVTSICENDTAPLLPTLSNNGITGTWSPTTVSNTATGTYTFSSAVGQCANPAPPITVTVKPFVTPTFSFVTSICENDTAPLLPTLSDNGITGTWNPTTVSNTATKTYTFTSAVGQCTNPAPPLTLTVKPFLTPTFSFVTSICENDTAPLLPTISDNGITGTWNPTTVSNTATGTYTFTSAVGQCANSAPPITVTVKPFVTPTFNAIPNVCYNSTPPTLPTISTNGISGTWNPSTVSNTVSALYIFTPTSGVCVATAQLNITVDTIIPVFNIVSSICANTTAPVLTSTSANGISGTWNPTTVSNTASGTYTFTPDAGQCATITIFSVTVNPNITPSFTAIPSLCFGTVSPVLPLRSDNGITGTWNPAVISNTTSGVYNFTPDIGECATDTTLNITVNPKVTPTFTAIAPLCSDAIAPVLPTTSSNLIIGTWNPDTVNNTASGTYTFTPTSGQCALTTTLSVTVYQSPTGFTTTTTDVVNESPNGIIEISGPIGGLAPYQYSINNGSFTANTSYPNLAPGIYTITIQDINGCQFNKVATINSICMFPNVITPNGDTFNDTLNLNGCDVVKLELFNRYGRKVNSYNNYTNQWGGTNEKGESLPDGTYFYVAEIKGGISKSGWVFIAE